MTAKYESVRCDDTADEKQVASRSPWIGTALASSLALNLVMLIIIGALRLDYGLPRFPSLPLELPAPSPPSPPPTPHVWSPPLRTSRSQSPLPSASQTPAPPSLQVAALPPRPPPNLPPPLSSPTLPSLPSWRSPAPPSTSTFLPSSPPRASSLRPSTAPTLLPPPSAPPSSAPLLSAQSARPSASPPRQPPLKKATWTTNPLVGEPRRGERCGKLDVAHSPPRCGAHDAAESLQQLARKCSSMVLGFSTGHVGTTTLCNKDSYRAEPARSAVKFFFEVCSLSPAAPQDIDTQAAHATAVYVPGLLAGLQSVRSPVTCVDLSHFWLSFSDGLLRVLNESVRPRHAASPTRACLPPHGAQLT